MEKKDLVGDIATKEWVLNKAIREIKRDSNDYGSWVVYSNGYAEYFGSRTVNMSISSGYGSLFIGTYDWTFPFTFSSIPTVHLREAKWGTGASWGSIIDATTSKAQIRVYDIVSRASSTGTYIGIYAKGIVNVSNFI